uniref:B30.2/SPRY domain-containing protein n=1 Tax=Globodera pallida TaxID=36090 RepID=A0A183CGQ7_GLOPA
MGIIFFLAAICFVVAVIQLETDASPPTSNKNTGLTPENQWNYAVHHWQLTLSEREQKSDATHSKPKQLVVEYTIEDRNVECSVFAVERIPTSGIFYYEVKIESKQWLQVFIGLATEQMKVNEGVGLAERTYAYDSSGLIWGHEVEGCEHGVNDRPYINKGIPFNDGHVVGCGVDLEKGQIFYTKNGEIVIAGLSVDASLLLFPCVSLSELDQKIEANFGPNFLFNPAVIEKLRTEQMGLMAGVGLAERTYAYDSLGNIWGHEVEGCEHGVNRRPYINKGIPSYGDGHVVGCGVDLEKGQIFYTINGEIVIAGLSVAKLPLFPCVSLTDNPTEVDNRTIKTIRQKWTIGQ